MQIVRLVGLILICGVVSLVIGPVSASAPSAVSRDHLGAFPSNPHTPNPNAVFELVNQQRMAHNLPPLAKSAVLYEAAQQRAQDMQRHNYYAHRGSDGKYFGSLLNDTLYEEAYACENLNLHFTLRPNQYVDDWLSSSAGHRDCLLSKDAQNAGYAVVEVAPRHGQDVKAYIVVAIHASD